MFRKLIPAALLAATAITGLAMTPATATARPLTILPHHRFEVLAWRNGCWESYGVYRLHVIAEGEAVKLRLRGLKAEIRQF